MGEIMQRCQKCGVIKPLRMFYKMSARSTGRDRWCIKCKRTHSEGAGRASHRASRLRKRGAKITTAEFSSLFSQFERGCQLCREPFLSQRDAHVDHDHCTGQVRGLICCVCNVSLRAVDSKPFWTEKAQGYLDRHNQKMQQMQGGDR